MKGLASLLNLKTLGLLAALGVGAGLGYTIFQNFASNKIECPEFVREGDLVKAWHDACGSGKPPYEIQEDLTGLWDVYAPGNPHVEELMISVYRQFGGVGWRTEDAAYATPVTSIEKAKGGNYYRNSGANISVMEDGSLTVTYGQYGYCNCRQMEFSVSPTTDPNKLVGTWKYQDESGEAMWMRRPSAEIHRVYYNNKSADPNQRFVRDKVAYNQRPLIVERTYPVTCGAGMSRGNCDGIRVTIEGENFAGAHQVWIDPASMLEIRDAGWFCEDGSRYDFGSDWHRCGSVRRPADGVAGLSLHLVMWDGLTPGIKTLWVNGQPIEFNFVLHTDTPEEVVPTPVEESDLNLLEAEGAASSVLL